VRHPQQQNARPDTVRGPPPHAVPQWKHATPADSSRPTDGSADTRNGAVWLMVLNAPLTKRFQG